MLIAILILVCLLIFLSLLNLGETMLIKRKVYKTPTGRLPVVKPDTLKTLNEEIGRIIRTGDQKEEATRWIDELLIEQPCLAEYLKVEASKEGCFDATKIISAIIVLRLLKAQAEADNLADLTKIRR